MFLTPKIVGHRHVPSEKSVTLGSFGSLCDAIFSTRTDGSLVCSVSPLPQKCLRNTVQTHPGETCDSALVYNLIQFRDKAVETP